jgi:HD-GYP domain-containing protein (c-di-GMP phosphodiesterase class II)
MSSDPHSDAPSPAPELDDELIRERGADLLAALEARLPGAAPHADETARWALAISAELGLARANALAVRETARLHAAGLLYVDAGLAGRPEQDLSDEERTELDRQAEAAARLAAGAGLPAAPCVWLEHWRECFDGDGPKGLYGGAIPLESRIIRAACAYATELAADADPDAALERLGDQADTTLDPATIGAIAFVLDRSRAS